MPNYKQSTVTGTQWTRSNAVHLNNPFGGIPSISFDEERILQTGDAVLQLGPVRVLGAELVQPFTDPDATFPLLNPIDDSVIGTATHGQVYALMYSLYRALADARDARLAE